MTRNARIALIVAAVAVAGVAALVIGSGGSDKKKDTAATTATTPAGPGRTTPAKPAPPPVPVIRVHDGKPVGGLKTLEFKHGERARFVVAADTKQQVHLHGYEIEKTVPAGGRVTFSFKAKNEGVYEVESHTSEQKLAKVKVVP
ncbi:MAG: hypothetical protein QOE65_1614 [Solirubrobacteraceae bacterium]|jgi:hypothetical protein|nr:hypothetical protein [Solirubrobacteraceae bacterium]